MGKSVCVSGVGGGFADTHLHRVRHGVLSQFPSLTLDVSGMQHRAELCARWSLSKQVPFVSFSHTVE